VAVIEIMTFRLAAGTDEASFLDADRRVQVEFIPRHPGFMRRTTARGVTTDGEWAVVVLWGSSSDADASRALAARHPAAQAFDALVDPSSVDVRRYETLE
jgi:hypothetical protein